MIELKMKTNLFQVQKALGNIAQKQIPYAKALALTGVARNIAAAETKALPKTFDRPTPFTMRGLGVIPAKKNSPSGQVVAVVFMKDIQASYLLPYETDGFDKPVKPNMVSLLRPKNIQLNQYGNIPRFTSKNYNKKPNYFIGTVKSKKFGDITGLWKRPRNRKTGHLVLMFRYGNPMKVKKHMNYRELAKQIMQKTYKDEIQKAIQKAMATAK